MTSMRPSTAPSGPYWDCGCPGRPAVAEYRGRGSAAATCQELVGGAEAVLAAAVLLVRQAESDVDVILASDAEHSLTAHADAGGLLAQASGTARLRVLCSTRTFAPHLLRAREQAAAAVDVRIGELRALEAIVVDGRVALARSDAGCPGQTIVVRSRPLVRAVSDLFDDVWRGAQVPPDPIDLGGPDRTAFARQVLRMLYTGCSDEAAAQELDVSVRTYRRYVAEIVAAVGAKSRFQAGMRAAAAGLLPPPP
jgi:DNA-binding CsgD family transcriptional regulator